ncbi:hypothetical protein ACP4OV_013366 [Aristida adscensionis]
MARLPHHVRGSRFRVLANRAVRADRAARPARVVVPEVNVVVNMSTPGTSQASGITNNHHLDDSDTDDTVFLPVSKKLDDLMIITTPALVFLHLVVYANQYGAGISVTESANLVRASISVQNNYGGSYFQRYLCKLLDGLSNVRNIELKNILPMVPIENEPQNFPTFGNLRTLVLEKCDISNNFQALGHFLQNAPNLEKLILQYCKVPREGKQSASRRGFLWDVRT